MALDEKCGRYCTVVPEGEVIAEGLKRADPVAIGLEQFTDNQKVIAYLSYELGLMNAAAEAPRQLCWGPYVYGANARCGYGDKNCPLQRWAGKTIVNLPELINSAREAEANGLPLSRPGILAVRVTVESPLALENNIRIEE